MAQILEYETVVCHVVFKNLEYKWKTEKETNDSTTLHCESHQNNEIIIFPEFAIKINIFKGGIGFFWWSVLPFVSSGYVKRS